MALTSEHFMNYKRRTVTGSVISVEGIDTSLYGPPE